MSVESRFRDVLAVEENVSSLVNDLGYADLAPLLIKTGALEKVEADEIKTVHRMDSKQQLRAIVAKILEKDTLGCYIGFSKVVQFKNGHLWQRLFPFAEHTKLQVTSRRDPHNGGAIACPHVLWLCGNRDIFEAARIVGNVPDRQLKTTPGGNFKYCELPPLVDSNDLPVWLFCPADNSFETMIHKLLQYYNKSSYFIFTGSASPVNMPLVQDNDICVVKPNDHMALAFVEELCHMTTLWDMDVEMKKPWQCSKVVFGSAGMSSFPGVDVVSTSGHTFCKSGEALLRSGKPVPYAAVLAVANPDQSKCYECGESPVYHSVQYSHQVVKYLCEKRMLLRCYDH